MSRSVRRRWRLSAATLTIGSPCARASASSSDRRAIARRSAVTTSREHAHGLAPGEPSEIDRRLRVPGALEHAAGAAAQRQDVARADEVAGDGVRIGERAERSRAIGGRDARRDPVSEVDRHRERGALRPPGCR